jgi:glycosidase
VLQGLKEKEDWGTGMRRIYRVLAVDALYPDPYNLVVFPDNHDVNRMFTVLDDRADLQRMAVTFFATIRGIPQVFYGTEILMASPGPKNDGVIRSGFPGGWAGDARSAFTGKGLSAAERSMQDYTRQLLQWRRTASAIHDGKLTHYVPFEGVYVYFRHNDAQKVMVILNNSDESRTVGTQRFGETIGTATRGTDVLSKQGHELAKGITVPGRSATILELN